MQPALKTVTRSCAFWADWRKNFHKFSWKFMFYPSKIGNVWRSIRLPSVARWRMLAQSSFSHDVASCRLRREVFSLRVMGRKKRGRGGVWWGRGSPALDVEECSLTNESNCPLMSFPANFSTCVAVSSSTLNFGRLHLPRRFCEPGFNAG